MKLLLTSAGWWKNPKIGKELVKLVGKKPADIKVFLVIAPTKYLKRNKYIVRQLKQFKGVRIPERNITFFQLNRKITSTDLKGVDVVFVFGGNTFEYLNGLRKTGLGTAIKKFVRKGGVYLGLSAGSYVVCPTIEAASWKHPDRNTPGLKNLAGLNLVPFLVTAHYEEKYRGIVTKEAGGVKYEVIVLTDKQAIIINGNKRTIIGPGKKLVLNSKK
jgi:dipeptidase E